jgi:2-haloacid dehalogenase
MPLDLSPFHCLTFDCYGTLIDWESGILGALRPILAAHGRRLSDAGILELYAAIEAQLESGPYLPYRDILDGVMIKMAARLAFSPTEHEVHSLSNSLPHWPPFPDTVPALRRLASRYRLAIISNVDDDLFAGTARHLEVRFDPVVTAQQARSYKPSQNNFRLALERIGLPTGQILHVAQSLYHDIAPAKDLGLSTVWINRRAGKPGPGATPPASAAADLILPDLASLADLAG